MDPRTQRQLFIRKNKKNLLIVLVMTIFILPLSLFLAQNTTQLQQYASVTQKENVNGPQKTPGILPGDIDQNNILDKQDFTLLTKCFDKPNQKNNLCSEKQHKAADLNGDGVVNGTDYNLLLRKVSVTVNK